MQRDVLHGKQRIPNWATLYRFLLESIFKYLEFPSLRNASLTCKSWYRILNNENNDVWRFHCVRRLAREALESDLLKNVPTYKRKLRAFYNAWNPNDCSRNMYIKKDAFTVHRNPIAQSTDAARGKVGFRCGRHCWEIWWQGPLVTVAVIDMDARPWDFQADECQLRNFVERFNKRRYAADHIFDPDFEPVDNCVLSVLGQPMELSDAFRQNYAAWLQQEVHSTPINWDLVLGKH